MATNNNGGAPVTLPEDFSLVFLPNTLSADQDFTLRVEATGKVKTISLPDGGQIELFPGLNVTLTNLENDKSIAFVATGSTKTSLLGDGMLEINVNGPSVVFDPFDPGDGTGVYFTAGHFTFTGLDVDGDLIIDELVQPLSGHGRIDQLIDNLL